MQLGGHFPSWCTDIMMEIKFSTLIGSCQREISPSNHKFMLIEMTSDACKVRFLWRKMTRNTDFVISTDLSGQSVYHDAGLVTLHQPRYF